MDKELAVGIIKDWVANGMTREDAVALFNDIATRKPAPYMPEPPEPVAVAEPVEERNHHKELYEYLMSLPKLERKIYFHNENVQMEEGWLNWMIANRKEMGYTISDIRKQRERVQWVKKNLQMLRSQQSDELKDSLKA